MIETPARVTVCPTPDDRLVLDFQFDYTIINKAKYLGAKWKKPNQAKNTKGFWWFKDNILNRQLLNQEFPGSVHVPDDTAASVFYETPRYLMKHQVDALRIARKYKRYGFFYDTGTGKTLIGINIAKMFAVKTLVVCPISIIENAWIDDVREFEPDISISNLWKAGKSKKRGAGIDYALEHDQICVINFESFKKYIPKFLKAGFQCLLVDECFIGNTLIDTPDGQRKISNIKAGDHITNCMGDSTVSKVHQRIFDTIDLVEIMINGKPVICSPNHKFFTINGLIEAQNLKKGNHVISTEHSMRIMQDRSEPVTNKETFEFTENKLDQETSVFTELRPTDVDWNFMCFMYHMWNEIIKTTNCCFSSQCKKEPQSNTILFPFMFQYKNKSTGCKKKSRNITNPFLQNMQDSINTETSYKPYIQQTKKGFDGRREPFLREILLSEMENGSGLNQEKILHEGTIRECEQRFEKVLSGRKSISIGNEIQNRAFELDERSSCPQKGIRHIEKNESQTINSRWKWTRINHTTKKIISGIRQGLDHRICYPDKGKKRKWISDLLQGRFGVSRQNDSGRNRWFQSQGNKTEGTGRKKNQEVECFRVDSVAIHKSASEFVNKYRDQNGKIILYDLTVDDHPSYSVNNMLVHNSSRMKSGTSSITKTLTEFGESIPYVYLFSGTPAPNGLDEYYSQMQILNPALFGRSYYKFEQDWMENADYMGFKKVVKSSREAEFLSKIATISSVVRKEDVLDLPERTDNIRSVQLSPKELKAYKDMLKDLSVEISSDLTGNDQDLKGAHIPLSGSSVYGIDEDMPDENLHSVEAANAAVKTMKLRQLTAGFLIDSENNGNIIEFGTSKFKELFLLLSEIGRKQVLIWTQFRHEADKIAWGFNQLKSTPTFGICNGSVNQAKKQEYIDGFKSGQIQYLIGHEKSIGHGITLTNCNIAIYFSESYSHEGHYQSKDRIYRKGQVNACTYYYLHADSSIDGIVHAALAEKASVEKTVFDYIKNSQLSN